MDGELASAVQFAASQPEGATAVVRCSRRLTPWGKWGWNGKPHVKCCLSTPASAGTHMLWRSQKYILALLLRSLKTNAFMPKNAGCVALNLILAGSPWASSSPSSQVGGCLTAGAAGARPGNMQLRTTTYMAPHIMVMGRMGPTQYSGGNISDRACGSRPSFARLFS